MNKWFLVAAVGVTVAVGVAVLAGKDDIARFLRMRNM